ncbi:hypothetical protein ACSQ67_016477 [Phaseolus vulgaris]
MGKYMKKSKNAGDVAALIMESPPPHSNLGVRTRAKTLALQNSPKLRTPPPTSSSAAAASSSCPLPSRKSPVAVPPPIPPPIPAYPKLPSPKRPCPAPLKSSRL